MIRKEVFACSPKALKKIDPKLLGVELQQMPTAEFSDYNLELLNVGNCVVFNLDEISENKARLLASRKGKALNKTFAVVKHAECYELVRIK